MLTFVEPQQQNLPVLGSFWGTALCIVLISYVRFLFLSQGAVVQTVHGTCNSLNLHCQKSWSPCPTKSEKFCFKNYSLFIFSPSKCLQGCLVHETPNQKSRYFCLFHDSVVSERPRALKAHTCSIHTCTALYSNIIDHWNTFKFSFKCLLRNNHAR